MVNVKSISMWNISVSMLFGKSPKIEYICGKCGGYNKDRISMKSVRLGRPYVVCKYCREINNTGLILD